MFLEDTLALKNRHLGRFSVYFVMSREPQHAALLNGRIDAARSRRSPRRSPTSRARTSISSAGPATWSMRCAARCERLNPSAPVRFERFAAAPATARAQRTAAANAAELPPGEVLAQISVVMDGRRRSFPMAPADASVLEAAERAGLELPFSCRAGICATCRTKVKSGQAVMAHNIALEPWEVDAGFILCCQARPLTASLELTYDEK